MIRYQNTSLALDLDNIPSEAPPAYTPTADPYQGEAPLEFGPRRPFQPPPQPVITPSVPAISINDTGRSTSDRGSGSQQHRFNFEPPPRHPSALPSSPASVNSSYEQNSSSSDHSRPSDDYRYSPTPPTPVRSYTPPPGPPPRRVVPISDRPSTSEDNFIPDDGRPTTTPTPGRPLLRGGKLLVYPNGFECSKCLYDLFCVFCLYFLDRWFIFF